MGRIATSGLFASLVIVVAACSDQNPAGLDQNGDKTVPGLSVSDAHLPAPPNTLATGLASPSASISSDALVAYVSAQPGTLPNGIVVKIRNETANGSEVLANIIDGGFDPVAIAAKSGDELSVIVRTLDGGSISYSVKVPPRRPPIVVRTKPEQGRIDIALTQVITAVFSEPIDMKTVNGSSIRLLNGNQAVSTAISTEDNGLSVDLAPSSPLEPQTTYTLIVGREIRDLDGDPLDVADTINFTTAAAPLLTPQQPAAFELTGSVTVDDGTPLSGAKIYISFLSSSQPGTNYSQIVATTNESGVYTIGFTAAPGAMRGPVGTENAVAFVWVQADCVWWGDPSKLCNSDMDLRYISGTNPRIVRDFKLHHTARINAGDSAIVTIAPDDAICDNNVQDMHPWPTEFVCRTVHIVAPVDGIMNIEAIPTQAGAAPPGLEVETLGVSPCCSERMANPTSLWVLAGTEVVANVEVPWGSSGSRPFVVKTSMTK